MKEEGKTDIKKVIKQFIMLANKFDVDGVLALFASNAVIDDVSVGKKFKNAAGVRSYFEDYFMSYKTVTKLESLNVMDANYAETKVDFKGNFGHETGGLNVRINSEGLIEFISAYLD